MQTHIVQRLLLAAVICLISACASDKPIPVQPQPMISGEAMMRESQGIAHLSERWRAGKQMVERGNALVRDGQIKIDEGNRMIDEGNKIVRESEESYKNIKN